MVIVLDCSMASPCRLVFIQLFNNDQYINDGQLGRSSGHRHDDKFNKSFSIVNQTCFVAFAIAILDIDYCCHENTVKRAVHAIVSWPNPAKITTASKAAFWLTMLWLKVIYMQVQVIRLGHDYVIISILEYEIQLLNHIFIGGLIDG